jgi:hypothetical protein
MLRFFAAPSFLITGYFSINSIKRGPMRSHMIKVAGIKAE